MQSQSSQVLCGNQPTQEVSCNAFNSSDHQRSTTLCLSCQLFCGLLLSLQLLKRCILPVLPDHFNLKKHAELKWPCCEPSSHG